jgi:hypothetical protein
MPANQKIYANYTQTLQKINHAAPVLDDLHDPKTVMIYAQQYGVEPCMDPAEFSRRVNNAVARKSQKVSMEKIYSLMSTSSKSIALDDFFNKVLGVILANLTPRLKNKIN